MEITLGKVVEAARQRRAAVTAEGGGYIILLATQRLSKAPCQVAPEGIGLNATGEISLAPSPASTPLESEIGLRRLLSGLLGLSQSAPPALRAAAERSAVGDLAALEAELMAALIPINHAAAGRALARLFRETQRAFRGATASAEGADSSPAPASSPALEARAMKPAPTRAAQLERATPPAPVGAAQLAVAPELEIDVDIVLGESARDAGASSAEAAEISHDDVEISAVEISAAELDGLEISVDDLDVAVAEMLAEVDAVPREIVLPAASAAVADCSSARVSGCAAADATASAAATPPAPAEELAPAVASPAPEGLAAEAAVEVAPAAEPAAGAAPEPAAAAAAESAAAPAPAAEPDARPDQLVGAELDELLSEVTPTTPAPPPVAVESPAEDELEDHPLPDTPLPGDFDREVPPQRSDLSELLNSYLAYTRCEEHMAADLRRMIGL